MKVFTFSFVLSLALLVFGLNRVGCAADATPVPATGFTNSLGMKFVAVPGTNTLFCIWLTRVQDYEAFVAATGRNWTRPDFAQGPTHPAVNVSWEDASAFADWLTQREHASGTLAAGCSYRLPTDAEWSAGVGLPANSPDGGDTIVYPWGTRWPPPSGAGNYSPELGVDPYPYTSPVGSFKANALGLYDMGGNVWEWCQDYFNNSPDYRVLRGASWRMRDPEDLVSTKRIGNKSDITLPVYGFRVVVELPAAAAPK